METELKSKLLEYLQSIESTAKDAGAFVASEAPLVAREYLNWIIFGYGLGALLLVGSGIVGIILAVKLFKYLHKQQMGDEPLAVMAAIVPVAMLVPGLILASQSLKAVVAPRIVIIEKLHDICK